MGRRLLALTLVVVLLALGLLLAGCRKSSGSKGGGGYLPAPNRSTPAASA
ncbi:MAG TPA: hypothetical protein VFD04_25325 [Actinomycetes bacterium]|jgi:hypothetical protein|nr:hypothetical protein [Actinomycetes bacterium]